VDTTLCNDRGRRNVARDARGYSIAEVLVVLGILGVTTSIGVFVANTSGWRTGAVASDLARRLELVRSQAAFNDHDFRIVFDDVGGLYTVHADRNNDGDVDEAIGEVATNFGLSASAEHIVFGCPAGVIGLDGAVVSDALTFAGSPPAATFRPGGSATPGVVYLIDKQDLARNDPSKMRAISVTEATGRVRRWRYDPDSGGPVPWRLER
jgi:Tfp pilus assembly protein FimT